MKITKNCQSEIMNKSAAANNRNSYYVWLHLDGLRFKKLVLTSNWIFSKFFMFKLLRFTGGWQFLRLLKSILLNRLINIFLEPVPISFVWFVVLQTSKINLNEDLEKTYSTNIPSYFNFSWEKLGFNFNKADNIHKQRSTNTT